jgi:hypothetical protein
MHTAGGLTVFREGAENNARAGVLPRAMQAGAR